MFMVNVAWTGTTRTHTHTCRDTQSVSQAVAPVSQMAVRINLKLSSAATTPPRLSVQLSVIIQAEMDVRGPLHISMSLFFFSTLFFPSLPSLPSRSPLNLESQPYKMLNFLR